MLEKIIAAASINHHNNSNENDDGHDSVDDDFDDNVDMDSDENLDDSLEREGQDSDENLGDSLEREGQDSDVHNDVGKLVDEENTPEENTSAPEIIAYIPPPDSSNLKQPACSGSKDYHHSMSDSSAERAFATLIVRTAYYIFSMVLITCLLQYSLPISLFSNAVFYINLF